MNRPAVRISFHADMKGQWTIEMVVYDNAPDRPVAIPVMVMILYPDEIA